MTNENEKTVAPDATKVEPAVATPAQQTQGDAKPSTEKPADQQQK